MNKPFKINRIKSVLAHIDNNSMYAINHVESTRFKINRARVVTYHLAVDAFKRCAHSGILN